MFLKCNVSEARKRYLEMNNKLPQELVESLLVRHLLLCENELFVKEWTILNEMPVSCEKEYMEKSDEFLHRWYINHSSGLHDIGKIPSLYARIVDSRIEEGKITIEVDLNGPEGKIFSEVESLISSWRKEFLDRLENHHNLRFKKENFIDKKKAARLIGNSKSGRNFDDFFRNVKILAAKNEGKTWSQIVKKFNLTSISTARNHAKSASKLVHDGFPGLPAFPIE